MNTPTYKEQFDKITTAYFKNELVPTVSCACFIGNMLNNKWAWCTLRDVLSCPITPYRPGLFDPEYKFYSMEEICQMEQNFLYTWVDNGKTEDALFAAMDSTLGMLRKIHESKGEVIEPIPFKKRELQTV